MKRERLLDIICFQSQVPEFFYVKSWRCCYTDVVRCSLPFAWFLSLLCFLQQLCLYCRFSPLWKHSLSLACKRGNIAGTFCCCYCKELSAVTVRCKQTVTTFDAESTGFATTFPSLHISMFCCIRALLWPCTYGTGCIIRICRLA